MSVNGEGPSENEGQRIRDADGIYEVIEGRRVWIEYSEEKGRMLRLDELAEQRQRRTRGGAWEGRGSEGSEGAEREEEEDAGREEEVIAY